MRRTRGYMLESAFHARAKLRATMSDLRRVMGGMACMKLVSSGTVVRYLVGSTVGGRGASAEVDFTASGVTFSFFFDAPSNHVYRRNLAEFMAILAYLKDIYTVEAGEIYGYVIDALRQDWAPELARWHGDENAKERIEALNGANVSLAGELAGLDRRVRELSGRLVPYEAFAHEVIGRLRRGAGLKNASAAGALESIGIDSKLSETIAGLVGDGHNGGANE